LEAIKLTLVERDLPVQIREAGRFTVGKLKAGEYTLEVAVNGSKPKRHKIKVPAPDYDLKA